LSGQSWPCVLITLPLLPLRRDVRSLLLQGESHSGRLFARFANEAIVTNMDYVNVVVVIVGRVSPPNTAQVVGVIVMARHFGGQRQENRAIECCGRGANMETMRVLNSWLGDVERATITEPFFRLNVTLNLPTLLEVPAQSFWMCSQGDPDIKLIPNHISSFISFIRIMLASVLPACSFDNPAQPDPHIAIAILSWQTVIFAREPIVCVHCLHYSSLVRFLLLARAEDYADSACRNVIPHMARHKLLPLENNPSFFVESAAVIPSLLAHRFIQRQRFTHVMPHVSSFLLAKEAFDQLVVHVHRWTHAVTFVSHNFPKLLDTGLRWTACSFFDAWRGSESLRYMVHKLQSGWDLVVDAENVPSTIAATSILHTCLKSLLTVSRSPSRPTPKMRRRNVSSSGTTSLFSISR
ncbi:hypothetical protein KCU61_g98, partial [Aureobasidium melanogenum]